ncbi:uracil phosphoribosyltransferase [Aspergillus candidus]|uniref:Putative phosphoribosyl transferase n=1 Tax=Aspergillus candidus TaxID=41067 RepID=A0A2I2F6B2_ASPCN|nr:putative phosphoribosyl transferase [Aspergillus candidus]PLB36128.1 putative phosphoribosyl transferase [Aspergillus candidus]
MTLPQNITQIADPKAAQLLTELRNLSLPPPTVRRLINELTSALAKHIPPPPTNDPIAVVVILRSGLSMVDSFVSSLPPSVADTAVIHHLGLFREKHTLGPVEYYNKLPKKNPAITRAYILDPLVATGGTATAAIDIMKDWGVEHVTLFSLLGSDPGLCAVASAWPEGTEVVVGAVDKEVDGKGFVKPGLGDIGDRLYGTALE